MWTEEVLETNRFQDRFNMYHLHLEILCARHQKLSTGRHPGNSAQYQDRSQHPCRGSFVCSFLMRDAVDVKVMSLAYCIDLLCRPSTGARAASSTLLCPEVLPIAPTLRELGAKIPLADSLSKDLCRVSKESYTLSKKPCSLWQLNYGTNMLVALVVGTLGRIFFHFLCRFAGCLDCNPASCHDISLYDCTPCVINHFSLSGFPGFSLGFKIV